jgi:hypothetical protein
MKRGPRPIGRPWTPEEDAQLLALLESKMDKDLIARKLKRTVNAISRRSRPRLTENWGLTAPKNMGCRPQVLPRFDADASVAPPRSRARRPSRERDARLELSQ